MINGLEIENPPGALGRLRLSTFSADRPSIAPKTVLSALLPLVFLLSSLSNLLLLYF
jgi:hypothetical protein